MTCFMNDMNVSQTQDSTNLSLRNEQKSPNIFVADQTPTPTCLIKNCDEVGLFEDLRHVNPFEETFRRAVEQKTGQTPANISEDSLHTPQVLLDDDDALQKPLENPDSADVTLDVPNVEDLLGMYKITSRQNSNSNKSITSCFGKVHKYRSIAEKPTTGEYCDSIPFVSSSNSLQLIQPQVITLTFHDNNEIVSNKKIGTTTSAIPVQTVKPFILPKEQHLHLSTTPSTTTNAASITPAQLPHEPSSASLTPTSQLPIKERLKAILSNSSKSRIVELPKKYNSPRKIAGAHPKSCGKYDEDCMERRRAAATRYRQKMRNEQKDLRKENFELQAENAKLRDRVRQLEQELTKQQASTMDKLLSSGSVPAQIQIPSSTIQLVMNIPPLLVPSSGQPKLQQPITYSVQKK